MRVCVAGEIDLAASEALTSRLRRLRAKNAHIQLDLSHVEFIDSTGVHVLTEQTADARRHGERLEVAAMCRGRSGAFSSCLGSRRFSNVRELRPHFPDSRWPSWRLGQRALSGSRR